MNGRDTLGRFAAGPSPDRGRGKPPARARFILDADMHRIVMTTANLPVSIAWGRGRRVVTLYEAQIRRLATGKVHRRASVMDFLRLVQDAAAHVPEPAPGAPSGAAARLQGHLDHLRAAAAMAQAPHLNRTAVAFYELLLDAVRRKLRS